MNVTKDDPIFDLRFDFSNNVACLVMHLRDHLFGELVLQKQGMWLDFFDEIKF